MNLPYPDSTHPGNTGGRAKRPDNRPQDPIEAPAPGVASVTQLINKLSDYLTPAELKKVKEAYRFSDEMHLGQVRKSGEPYISHPIAVAEICAEWKLDAQAIMAALLHDVIEDQDVKKDDLVERFGAQVANLVDGLSKLEKIEFQSLVEAQAENFRKMLLAMASDVRVILIKLADRLHKRGTDEPHIITRRLLAAGGEMAHAPEFEYAIINEEFNVALAELQAIVKATRCRFAQQAARNATLFAQLGIHAQQPQP